MVTVMIVVMVIVLIFAMMAMMVIYAANYKTVPPNMAMVLFRGKRREGDVPRGIMSGGGKFIMPGAESFHLLDLTVDLVEFEMTGVPTMSNGRPIKMRVQVAVVWKISSSKETLKANATKLVDRTRGENQMSVKDTMEQHLRQIAASVTLEEFESDRDLVASKVSYAARDLMENLGLEIRSLVFLNVKPQA